MWFGKAVDDFNTSIISQGQQGPKLIASTGNAFTSESKKAILVFFFDSNLTRISQWFGWLTLFMPFQLSLPSQNST